MVCQSSTILYQLPTVCINILLTPKGTYFLFLLPTKIKSSNLFYNHISKKSQNNTIHLPIPPIQPSSIRRRHQYITKNTEYYNINPPPEE
jgi:hypothetical protein